MLSPWLQGGIGQWEGRVLAGAGRLRQLLCHHELLERQPTSPSGGDETPLQRELRSAGRRGDYCACGLAAWHADRAFWLTRQDEHCVAESFRFEIVVVRLKIVSEIHP